MSSNKYSAYVSQNLVRTSPFGYRDHADLCTLLETVVGQGTERKLPLARMTAFPNFGTVCKIRVPTAPQSVTFSCFSKAISDETPNQI